MVGQRTKEATEKKYLSLSGDDVKLMREKIQEDKNAKTRCNTAGKNLKKLES